MAIGDEVDVGGAKLGGEAAGRIIGESSRDQNLKFTSDCFKRY